MRLMMVGLDSMRVAQIPVCACIGYFDGVHKGHQALIAKTVEMAKMKNCESAMITFDPDPWVTIKGLKDVKHISLMRQRMNKAVSLGIQNLIVLRFTKEMSMLTPEDFLDKVLGKLNLQGIVCGFDFHYGAMGKGDCTTLQQQAKYEVQVVSEVDDTLGKISSTRISEYLVAGEMKKVSELLGYHYTIEGSVGHGNHQGREIGFPTANVRYSNEYLLPKPGVYACYVNVRGKRYQGMVNLGHNPTFNYSEQLSLETYILDFHDDIYGYTIGIEFVEFIRSEMKFRSRANLALQLEQDVREVREILNHDE